MKLVYHARHLTWTATQTCHGRLLLAEGCTMSETMLTLAVMVYERVYQLEMEKHGY